MLELSHQPCQEPQEGPGAVPWVATLPTAEDGTFSLLLQACLVRLGSTRGEQQWHKKRKGKKKGSEDFERAGTRINSGSKPCSITGGPRSSWKEQLTRRLCERLEEGGSDLDGGIAFKPCRLRPASL
ncbi:uncharacterized protein VSU04_011867 isoform 1-T1 [Chlamydotis macqueenii]